MKPSIWLLLTLASVMGCGWNSDSGITDLKFETVEVAAITDRISDGQPHVGEPVYFEKYPDRRQLRVFFSTKIDLRFIKNGRLEYVPYVGRGPDAPAYPLLLNPGSANIIYYEKTIFEADGHGGRARLPHGIEINRDVLRHYYYTYAPIRHLREEPHQFWYVDFYDLQADPHEMLIQLYYWDDRNDAAVTNAFVVPQEAIANALATTTLAR